MMDSDLLVLALCKGDERYVLVYDEYRKRDAYRAVYNWAMNEDLTFSQHDAVVLIEKIERFK